MKPKNYLAWVRVSCVLPLLLACGSKDPCPGVVDGASYSVEVTHEQTPSMPAAGCQESWGISQGLVITATASRLDGGECLVAIPALDGVTGWTFEESNTEVNSGGFMQGLYHASSSNCSALLSFKLAASGPNFPCFRQGGGKTDSCLMTLTFEPRSGGCAASCSAALATTVTRR